jgi:hypothetical protein
MQQQGEEKGEVPLPAAYRRWSACRSGTDRSERGRWPPCGSEGEVTSGNIGKGKVVGVLSVQIEDSVQIGMGKIAGMQRRRSSAAGSIFTGAELRGGGGGVSPAWVVGGGWTP